MAAVNQSEHTEEVAREKQHMQSKEAVPVISTCRAHLIKRLAPQRRLNVIRPRLKIVSLLPHPTKRLIKRGSMS